MQTNFHSHLVAFKEHYYVNKIWFYNSAYLNIHTVYCISKCNNI